LQETKRKTQDWYYGYIPKGYHKTIPKRLSENKVEKNPQEKNASATLQQTNLQVFSFNSGQDLLVIHETAR